MPDWSQYVFLYSKALGVSGVLPGRAMVYAVGAAGQQGVSQLLETLEKELRPTMGLAGKTRFGDITATDVDRVDA